MVVAEGDETKTVLELEDLACDRVAGSLWVAWLGFLRGYGLQVQSGKVEKVRVGCEARQGVTGDGGVDQEAKSENCEERPGGLRAICCMNPCSEQEDE